MSLLDRLEGTAAPYKGEDAIAKRKNTKENLRNALYEQLPSGRIAELVSKDSDLAMREVQGALDITLRSREFVDLGSAAKKEISDEVAAMVLGLGPLQGLIDDPDVTEIMANGPHDVFYERDGRLYRSDAVFDDERQMRAVIDRILGPVGRRVDEQSPMVSARLPQGHRANIVVHPVALDGPYITIRKFARKMFTLSQMADLGTMDSAVAEMLGWAVRLRKNIAVSGGTGSGKTTLLNALSHEIPHGDRIVTIEDSAELRFVSHPHVVRLESRPVNSEGTGEVNIRSLVINALRMRPDRIVVGECRGAEALDMLQAMNTGHDGSLTTLHANSTQEVPNRLVTMVRFGTDLSRDVVEDQIASALDLIVHVQRMWDGSRKLVEVSECAREPDGVSCGWMARWNASKGCYSWRVPGWVGQVVEAGIANREEVERWKLLVSESSRASAG